MAEYRDLKLNPQQKKAVEHKNGPLLIIAGAGTGKTCVITQRLVWLIEKAMAKPSEILALTFTQKAALEMEERVDVAMPYGYEQIWISTFHSFCDRILRQECISIGLDPGYVLMSQAQEYVYFRSKIFELPLDVFRPHGNPAKFIGAILQHFSRLADEDISPEDYVKFAKGAKALSKEERVKLRELASIYKLYLGFKEKESRVGFSDLVNLTLRLFRQRPEVLKKYRSQFKYILVDEFQDTNFAQNELVKLLAPGNSNITVVGDDDQAIYKFRGAAISNILDFKKTYPKAKKVVLTKNYRNNQAILDTAYKLIRKNDPYRLEVTEKIDKKLNRVGEGVEDQIQMDLSRDCVRRIHAFNGDDEAELVSREIVKLVKDKSLGVNYSDIALLVRANNHSELFVKNFRYHGIPYVFPGPKGLYNRPEIKDMIAYIQALANYKDNVSVHRVLSSYGSEVTVRELIELQGLARKRKISLFALLECLTGSQVGHKQGNKGKKARKDDHEDEPSDFEDLASVSGQILSKESQLYIANLMEAFEQGFQMVYKQFPVSAILYDFLVRSRYLEHLQSQKSIENEWRIQNIGRYFELLKGFERETSNPDLYGYVDYLEYSLEIGENPQVDEMDLREVDAVNVMTVHAAKGLEFPVVFIANLVNERFPTRRRSDPLPIPDALVKEILPEEDEHLQEERRLLYVGMTRARRLLYFTSADYYGDGIRKKKQSIFLHDIGLIYDEQTSKLNIPPRVYRSLEEAEVPRDLGRAFLSDIRRNLSYSHISSYDNCPYQFYFKYFLKVPGAESAARSFGMTIHNTLKAFYDNLMRFHEGFEGFNKLPSFQDLLKIYESKWQSGGYESKIQEKKRFDSGKKALQLFFKKLWDPEDRPVWLEGRFRISIEDLWVRGTVDRLDMTSNGLEIIDYKTGKPRKDKSKDGDNLQLAIYAIAVDQIKNEKAKQASLIYVETQDKLSIKVTESLKDRARSKVLDAYKQIEKLKFEPRPGLLCKFCDYKGLCNFAVIG